MRSGKYISQSEKDIRYKAFIPNVLPFVIKRDPELDVLLSEADLALGRLDNVSGIVPDVDFITFMYGLKESTFSSQVEGTQATFIDVLKAEAKIEDKTIPSDVKEITNYIHAMNHGLKTLDKLPISLRLLKNIHKILLKGVRGEKKNPGEFRKEQNWVGGPTMETATFIPPPSYRIMHYLDNLEKFFHDKHQIPALIKVALIHSQFENIHPFLDGNGRVGRLLVTFYLCQQRTLQEPLLYLSVYFKKHQKEYYFRLRNVHEKDDIEGWIKFFLKGVKNTAIEGLSTTKAILKLKDRDTKKIFKLGRTTEKGMITLNNLYENPITNLNNIIATTKLSKSNAYNLLKKLEKLEILHYIPDKSQKTKTYVYKDYLDLFE